MPTYTEADLAQLIKGLESEFTKEFEKSGVLAKSEDGDKKDKKPSDEKKDGPPAEAKPESKEAAPAAPAAEGQEAAPAVPPAAAAPAAPAAAPGAAPAAEGHGYDAEDMEHMMSMYASMSRAELIAHHDAVKAALDSQAGAAAAPAAGAPPPAAPGAEMGKSEHKSEVSDENPTLNSKPKAGGKDMNADAKNGGIVGQQPSGSPGAKSPASDASKSVQMSKTERQDRNGGKIEASPVRNSPGAKSPASTDQGNLSDMEKSEKEQFDLIKTELDAEKAKNADMKKNMDAVQGFLTKFVEKIAAPKGKAITEIGTLAKSEGGGSETGEMSKSEITAKLLVKSADPKTTPQDRHAINQFYLNGANVNTISHLLK